ncbi:MAG: G8 domain-containing protein [Pseudomonadota bacterium]
MSSITFVVFDGDGDIVAEVTDGDSLDFGMADTSEYQLGALIDGDEIKSVVFEVDGQPHMQHLVPWDTPADMVDFTDGEKTVSATVFSRVRGEGDVLGTDTITFSSTAMVMDDDDSDADMPPMDHGDDHDGEDMPPMDHGDDHDGQDMPPMDHGDDHDGQDMPPMDHGDDHDGQDMPPMDHGDDHDGQDMPPMDHGDDQDGQDMPPMDHGDDHDGQDMPPMDHGDDHDGHGGGQHHGGHGDHTMTPAIDPPGIGASRADVNTYLDALADLPETHSHSHGSGKANEHMAAMDLAPRGDATHVAIGDGDWFDPNTWSGGVPGDGAKVLIPEGVTVTYDEVSDARLFTVRVDGKLEFATDTDSQMVFDTMLVSPSGYLEIGTVGNPVDANVDVDLIVANNGRIDTDWDPMLLSRGVISHGKTSIHGAEKDSHEKVTTDPMEGDTSIKFASTPEGWDVGDTIVIAGTEYEGWSGNRKVFLPPEDEVRVITKIDSNGRVHFDEPLVHDHDTPRPDLKTSVANYTRNVSVETEGGDGAEIHERGHVMFMHSDEVDVRYAEFTELGRTDKSEDSQSISDINNVRFDSNVQGRYSLHIHRAGTEDLADPAILEGNAVYGSPGWGVVHHDSNAVLTNNATYDTFGAGFVAETGNETGLWEDNIAIYAKGIHWGIPKNTSEITSNFDTARGGEGFWFQGRMVEAVDNVAASVNIGFAYFHRDKTDTTIDFDAELFDFPDALDYDDDVTPDDVPILVFDGNETFAGHEGLHVVKANTAQGHDIWSHLTDFTAWSVENGAHLQYTSHYILEGFDVVGKDDGPYRDADTGIVLGNNISEIVIRDAKIEGFDTGIDLNKNFVNPNFSKNQHDYFVIDAEMKNVGQEYDNYDPKLDTVISSDDIRGNAPDLDMDRMVYKGGLMQITGEKTDGLGKVDFPNGMDEFQLRKEGVENFLEKGGYWTTSDGKDYFLMKVYFTDRATFEVYYENHPVYVESGVNLDRYENNGEQDIVTRGGETKAGDIILDEPLPAEPTGGFALAYLNGVPASSTKAWVSTEHDTHMAHGDDHSAHASDMMMIPSTMENAESPETLVLLSTEANDDFSIGETHMGHDFSEFYAGPLEGDQPAVEDTSSEEPAVTASGEVLWDALTSSQPVLADHAMAKDDDATEEMLMSA